MALTANQKLYKKWYDIQISRGVEPSIARRMALSTMNQWRKRKPTKTSIARKKRLTKIRRAKRKAAGPLLRNPRRKKRTKIVHVLIANPRKRKGKKTMAKRRKRTRRNPRRKLRAITRLGRSKRRRTVYINPRRRRSRRRRATTITVKNPRRRRRLRANPRRRYRRTRRNPSGGGFFGLLKATFTPYAAGFITSMACAAIDKATTTMPMVRNVGKLGLAVAVAGFLGRKHPNLAAGAIGALAASNGYRLGVKLTGGVVAQDPAEFIQGMGAMQQTYPELGALLSGGVGALLSGPPDVDDTVVNYQTALNNMGSHDDDDNY